MSNNQVAVWRQENAGYSNRPPYNPPFAYPELRAGGAYDDSNTTYDSLRQLFVLLGYDAANVGTRNWNPLGWLIHPGNTVFIKPNFIAERHAHEEEWRHVITHGSVLRAIIDYVFLALKGEGRIQLGDAPQTDSNISAIREQTGFDAIQELYRQKFGFEIEFLDLRGEQWENHEGVITKRTAQTGDSLGMARVNLGHNSYFDEIDHLGRRYYGAFYDVEETNRHHRAGVHEYMVARSPLAADVFISVPKMKTHKKVGVTLNLKGLVGIGADKNYLPHYAIGSPESNGDQFPAQRMSGRLENVLVGSGRKLLAGGSPVATYAGRMLKPWMYRMFGSTSQTIRSGNWWGNDTCWRTALDLNRLLLYLQPDGSFAETRKPYFSVVDGIIAMEGDGPVAGTAKNAGLLLCGPDPAGVDAVAAALMGFDCNFLPMIRRSFDRHTYRVAGVNWEQIICVSNRPAYNRPLSQIVPEDTLGFVPHFGWKGRIELEAAQSAPACVAL